MIKARVFEKQWGGSIMDYVRYFESVEAIEEFRSETGFDVEVLDTQETEESKLSNVIDFGAKLAEKKEAEEAADLADYFLNEILPELRDDEKLELLDAIGNGDEAKYRTITEPAIMRKVLRQFNESVGGGR